MIFIYEANQTKQKIQNKAYRLSPLDLALSVQLVLSFLGDGWNIISLTGWQQLWSFLNLIFGRFLLIFSFNFLLFDFKKIFLGWKKIYLGGVGCPNFF